MNFVAAGGGRAKDSVSLSHDRSPLQTTPVAVPGITKSSSLKTKAKTIPTDLP